MNRKTKNYLEGKLHDVFRLGQRVGLNVLPRHFYSEIPYLAELKRETYWRASKTMIGVAGMNDVAKQVAFLNETCAPGIVEHMIDVHARADALNGEDGGYGEVEADFLYCFICRHKPNKIIQIGCGVSTAVIRMAAEKVGYESEIVCIDPNPTPFLIELESKGQITLHAEKT